MPNEVKELVEACFNEMKFMSQTGIGISYEVWRAALNSYPEGYHSSDLRDFFKDSTVQMNLNMRLDSALKRKASNLTETNFSKPTQSQIIDIWQSGADNLNTADRLGRFDRFSRGWNKVQNHKLLMRLIQSILPEDCNPDMAIQRAYEYVSKDKSPLKKVSRFSEVLHLTRPDVFPVVNEANALAVMWVSESSSEIMEDREVYLDSIVRLKEIRDAFGVGCWFHFDLLCHALDWRVQRMIDLEDESTLYQARQTVSRFVALASGHSPGKPYAPVDENIEVQRAMGVHAQQLAQLTESVQAHRRIQNEIASRLSKAGLEPLSPMPDMAQYDIAWVDEDGLSIVEVKSLNDSNETEQLRMGIGQLCEYREQIRRATGEVPYSFLALSRKPNDDIWEAVAEESAIALIWPPNYGDFF